MTRDPLEMKNLAHATHRTPASEVERVRLHQHLVEVMRTNGTAPDRIRRPAVEGYQPSTTLAVASESEEAASL